MNTLTVRRILGLLPLSCIVNIKRAHLVLEQMSNNRPGASSEFSIRTESLKSLSNFWPEATIMKIVFDTCRFGTRKFRTCLYIFLTNLT